MICETMAGDNRFEIIAKAKYAILDGTNIETDEDEMKVLDNILFRCWQMGWLDKYDDTKKQTEWIPVSKKLPETGDSILVTYSDEEVGIVWDARPEVWGKYEKANNLIFPIAWMPLPDPYREDGEE